MLENLTHKVLMVLPEPERQPNGTYDIYFSYKDIITGETKTRLKNYKDKAFAEQEIKRLERIRVKTKNINQ